MENETPVAWVGCIWSVGIKSQLTDSLEVELVGRYLDARLVDEEYGYYRPSNLVLGLHHKIIDEVSLYLDLEKGSESERSTFGIRYDF